VDIAKGVDAVCHLANVLSSEPLAESNVRAHDVFAPTGLRVPPNLSG
jgi:hypothetical protein